MRMIGLATAIGMLTLVGCIKRGESITVAHDGSACLVMSALGDAADFAGGDCFPSTAGGWAVQEETNVNSNGEKEHTLIAARWVKPNEPWPDTYAIASSPLAHAALRFPTTLQVERKEEGTYYHFRRRYVGRPWAAVEHQRQSLLETDPVKSLLDKSPETLTDDERHTIADSLIRFKARRAIIYLQDAATAKPSLLSQSAYLEARQVILKLFESQEMTDRITRVLKEQENSKDSEPFDQEMDRKVELALRNTLSRLGVSKRNISAFVEAYTKSREYYQVTEDLDDEDWEIQVTMPGVIIGHNSLSKDKPEPADFTIDTDEPLSPEVMKIVGTMGNGAKASEFSKITFSFEGKALHDRDIWILASSFVANEAE